MIKNKKWSQLSLLEITKAQRTHRKSPMTMKRFSIAEYFPTSPYMHDKDREYDVSYIITPESRYKFTWDMVAIILIIYQCLYVPFILCFDLQSEPFCIYSDSLIFVFFLIDLLLTLNLALYRDGELII